MSSNRLALWVSAAALAFGCAAAQAQAVKPPDALIKEVSTDVLDAVKADKQHQGRATSRRSSRWSTPR